MFAATNDFHCPHISYEPEEDGNGDVKCQVSQPGEDISADDMAFYDKFLLENGLNATTGFTLLPTLPCSANSDCPVGLICDLEITPSRTRSVLFSSVPAAGACGAK